MKYKHTPGPWVLCGDLTEEPYTWIVMRDTATEVARGITKLEDANLIAAAPEMLEALQAMGVMPWGYCFCPGRMGNMEGKPDEEHCGECREARAAIAKARGEK